MYVLSYIKQGFGNKIFLLQNIIYFYLELRKVNPLFQKIYVAIIKSPHEKNSSLSSTEEFLNIFPNFFNNKYLDIEFISFREYDTLNKDNFNVEQGTLQNKDFKQFKYITQPITFKADYIFSLIPINSYYKLFKNLFAINKDLVASLLYKYDYNNDVLMHVRYGDKLTINKKTGTKDKYLLLKPQYYFDALYDLTERNKNIKKVYIFTDSPKNVKDMFMSQFKEIEGVKFIISDEPYWNVFYLCSKFKNIILSMSTLTYAGLSFNEHYKNVITFAYEYYQEDFTSGNWPNPPPKIFSYKKRKYFPYTLNKKDYIVYKDFNYLLINF